MTTPAAPPLIRSNPIAHAGHIVLGGPASDPSGPGKGWEQPPPDLNLRLRAPRAGPGLWPLADPPVFELDHGSADRNVVVTASLQPGIIH